MIITTIQNLPKIYERFKLPVLLILLGFITSFIVELKLLSPMHILSKVNSLLAIFSNFFLIMTVLEERNVLTNRLKTIYLAFLSFFAIYYLNYSYIEGEIFWLSTSLILFTAPYHFAKSSKLSQINFYKKLCVLSWRIFLRAFILLLLLQISAEFLNKFIAIKYLNLLLSNFIAASFSLAYLYYFPMSYEDETSRFESIGKFFKNHLKNFNIIFLFTIAFAIFATIMMPPNNSLTSIKWPEYCAFILVLVNFFAKIFLNEENFENAEKAKKYHVNFYILNSILLLMVIVGLVAQDQEILPRASYYEVLATSVFLLIYAIYAIIRRSEKFHNLFLALAILYFLMPIWPIKINEITARAHAEKFVEIALKNNMMQNEKIVKSPKSLKSRDKELFEDVLSYLNEVNGFSLIAPYFSGESYIMSFKKRRISTQEILKKDLGVD